MKIFTNVIFLAFVCFARYKCTEGSGRLDLNAALGTDSEPRCAELEHIQLRSHATLKDLFPGFDGLHLPIPIAIRDPEFPEYADKIRKFNDIDTPIEIDPCTLMVKRGNVIVGVKLNNGIIQPVTSPAGEFNMVYVPGRGFVQLSGNDIFRLGVHQQFSYVDNFERTASTEARALRIDQRAYPKQFAEIEAFENTTVKAAYQRYSQLKQAGHGNDSKDLEVLWEAYQRKYQDVYEQIYRQTSARMTRFRNVQKKYSGLWSEIGAERPL